MSFERKHSSNQPLLVKEIPPYKMSLTPENLFVLDFNDIEKKGTSLLAETPLEVSKKVIYSDKPTRRLLIFILSIPRGLGNLKDMVQDLKYSGL